VTFFHEAAVYDTDEEFLGVVTPFLRAGVAAGEPTLLGVNRRQEGLVREALDGDVEGVTLLAGDAQYANPLSALRLNTALFSNHVEAGASRVRIVGEVPHPGTGAAWDGWVRYEAAINHLYSALPVWGICPYDTRNTPADVLADVRRLHTHLATPGGSVPSAGYTDPAEFLAERAALAIDVLERTAPHVELDDPRPADGRHAVAALARAAGLDDDGTDDAVLAVNEAVSNALAHGLPPVRMRAWASADRVVVAVSDGGAGPTDPFAGLLPGRPSGLHAGLGLWVLNQVCSRVALTHGAAGFTVRFVVGTPRS
jgi:anti-sigma regulatory factor (Ser/Thr protein kinase)